MDGGDVAVVHVESDDLAACRDRRAARGSRPCDGDDEACAIGLMIVETPPARSRWTAAREPAERAGGCDDQRGAVAEAGERPVGDHARADGDRSVRTVGPQRHAEAERAHEVGCDDAGERTALGVRLAHELHIAHAQVPRPPWMSLEESLDVQAARSSRSNSATRSPARAAIIDAGADDSASNNHDVERLVSKGRCGGIAVHPCCVSRPPRPL